MYRWVEKSEKGFRKLPDSVRGIVVFLILWVEEFFGSGTVTRVLF